MIFQNRNKVDGHDWEMSSGGLELGDCDWSLTVHGVSVGVSLEVGFFRFNEDKAGYKTRASLGG